MGDQWIQIGWETSEQLAVQERQYYVKLIRRAKYIRVCADEQGQNTQGIQVAPPLPVILPRAIADASLLAKICTGKFVDALSFNRECKVLAREGIEIGYSTLCSYPIQLTQRLEPLQALLYEYAARSSRYGIWMKPRYRCLMSRIGMRDRKAISMRCGLGHPERKW